MSRSRAQRAYLARLVDLGCIVCGGPAEVHHIGVEGMGRRAGDDEAIPLCVLHHRTGGHGVAVHAGRQTWEARHGTERALLALVRERLQVAA